MFMDPKIVLSRVYARTCFIASTLGDSGARQSARDTRPLFFSASSASSSCFASRPLFPLPARSNPPTRRIGRGHGPNEQVAKRASTPGCGADTRSLMLRYVKLRHVPVFLSFSPLFLPPLAFLPVGQNGVGSSGIEAFGKSIEGN